MSCECKLAAISNKYGFDTEFVLAGGGNTSYKNENTLYIRARAPLATIKPKNLSVWTGCSPECGIPLSFK